MSAFWDAWHKEIIRGATLFCAVLAIGFFAHFLAGRVKEGVKSLPVALRDLRSEFAPDAGGGPRTTGGSWTYRAKVAAKQSVSIRNVRGSITVEPATGDSLQVTAVKTYRSSDTGSVRLVAAPYDGGIAVCAVWQGGDQTCGPEEGDLKLGRPRRNDVAVAFTVRLPRNVRLSATTFAGDVHVTGARAPLIIHTVSGDIDVATTRGPVRAESMNGDVRIQMQAFADTGAVSATTWNGSLTAELPAQLDADVEAKTGNGSITTDYPLTVNGKFMGHDVKGTLGRGGRLVHLETVNGSIKLKKAL